MTKGYRISHDHEGIIELVCRPSHYLLLQLWAQVLNLLLEASDVVDVPVEVRLRGGGRECVLSSQYQEGKEAKIESKG